MTHNLYQPRSYWALTQLLISGLIGSWVPQTGELIYCLLNLKFFFHSRSCLHQAVTPATLPLSKSSKWLLLSATGPESSLGQPISLATMILVHRGLSVDCLPMCLVKSIHTEVQVWITTVLSSCPQFPPGQDSPGSSGLWQPGYREMWRTKENVPWQT